MKKILLKLTFLLLISCLIVFPTKAAKIIVAPSGGNYTTINNGLNAAVAGDTVFIKAGTYNENVTVSKSGNITNGFITILGEQGSIIDGTGKSGNAILISSKNYIRIIGVEIQNFKGTNTPIGIFVTGSSNNIELRNNKVHNIEYPTGNAHGIAVYGTNATAISNLLIDGNEIYNCKLGQSESLVVNGNVNNFKVSNNHVHDNDNIGIDFIGFETTGPLGFDQANHGVCVGNLVYNCSSATNPTYNGELSADGIYVDGGRDIIIEKNTVYNCDIGIELASEHQGKNTENIIIRNNFVSGAYQANIMVGGYAAKRGNAVNIAIVNNTTYQGSQGEIALQFNSNNVSIMNNILFAKSSQSYVQNWGSNNTNIKLENNLYYGESTSSPGDWPDTKAKYVNPQLESPYLNMHVKSNSPAINAGVDSGVDSLGNSIAGAFDIDGNARVNGTIDIGADEYYPYSSIDVNNTEADEIIMFPNPVSSTLYIKGIKNVSIIKLQSITGNEIASYLPVSDPLIINVELIPDGIYILNCIFTNRVVSKKIVIQK